jgi:hypothetical protein
MVISKGPSNFALAAEFTQGSGFGVVVDVVEEATDVLGQHRFGVLGSGDDWWVGVMKVELHGYGSRGTVSSRPKGSCSAPDLFKASVMRVGKENERVGGVGLCGKPYGFA